MGVSGESGGCPASHAGWAHASLYVLVWEHRWPSLTWAFCGAQAGFRGDTFLANEKAPPAPAPAAAASRPRLPQVPYETLNKRFRAAQKSIDRETSHVSAAVAELERTLGGCPAVDSVVSLLDGVVEKLSVLKRKVSAPAARPACPAPSRRRPRAPPSPAAPGGAVRRVSAPPTRPALGLCRREAGFPSPPSSSRLHVSWVQDGSRVIISSVSPQNSTLAFLFLRMVDNPPSEIRFLKTFYQKCRELMRQKASGLENTRSGVGWGRR